MVTSSRSSYLNILDAAWQAHLAARSLDAPTVVSLFAGCGGSSLGYSMAGYRELLAVEWDANAVATFGLNFTDVPIYHGDIAKLSVDECLRLAGVAPGELDVLDGSPPCQGFSTAGKRKLNDPRNDLFREYVRLLRGLRPRAFVMENVSGMVKGKMKLVFAEAMRELKASGYRVSARLMNAMYFDVPQSRARMIFVGVRSDLDIEPSHPRATAKPQTVKNVMSDAAMIGTAPPHRDWVASCRDVRSTLVSANRPSPTLVKTMPNKGVGFVLTEAGQLRAYADKELAAIGSFPPQFQWLERGASERIGNSVPPLFMRAIAQHIRDHLLVVRLTERAEAAD